jgi:hypothetical protein
MKTINLNCADNGLECNPATLSCQIKTGCKEVGDYLEVTIDYQLQDINKYTNPKLCESEPSDTLKKWVCINNAPSLVTINCADHGLVCYNGECTQKKECEESSTDCGNPCVEIKEDECELDGERRLVTYNSKDGTCVNGECKYQGCITYSNNDYCTGFVSDEDGDGVLDIDDNCPDTPLYDGMQVNEFGCYPLVRYPYGNVCRKLDGKGSNINIVFVPCGFSEREQSIFIYWVKNFVDAFKYTEPFQSYPDKYSLYYVWNTDKKDYVGYELDESGNQIAGDRCGTTDASAVSQQIVSNAECINDNLIIIDISHNMVLDSHTGELGESNTYVSGKAFESLIEGAAAGSISQGFSNMCPRVLDACINLNDELKSLMFHELGHLFKSAHLFGGNVPTEVIDDQYTDHFYQDYYSPEIPPLETSPTNVPCPIWDYTSSKILDWGSKTGQQVNCIPGYATNDAYKYTYRSENTPTYMSYDFIQADVYDPVTLSHIEDALVSGYSVFREYVYPTNCQEIPTSSYFTEVLGLSEAELNIMMQDCLIKACRYVDPNEKSECCIDIKGGTINSALASLSLITLSTADEAKYQECITNS